MNNEWIDDAIPPMLEKSRNILALTTLYPLCRVAEHIGDVPNYQLSHPGSVTADCAITSFSEIQTGDEIVLMQGTMDSLIRRAGRVADSALEMVLSGNAAVAGALTWISLPLIQVEGVIPVPWNDSFLGREEMLYSNYLEYILAKSLSGTSSPFPLQLSLILFLCSKLYL